MTRPVIRTRRCACGCRRIVRRKYGRLRRFVSRAHYHRALAGPAYAAFRRHRAMKAGAAARESRRRRAVARAATRFRTRAIAYQVGYRTGWHAAYRWWRRKYDRALAVKGAVA